MPALDGLRGVAVAAVIAFHSGATWATGGFLGVSLFFTLSGFLITALLLSEAELGPVSIVAFWGRRARRLLPAALLTLGVVAIVSRWLDPALAQIRGDIVASLAYVANWRFIASEQSYGDLFSAPSPLVHFWSLAIEEQFYVIFPLLLVGLHRVVGRRGFVLSLVLLTSASALAPTLFGLGPDRVYYGTDTRAAELLVGALLATATVRGGTFVAVGARWRRWLDYAAGAAAVMLASAWINVGQSDLLLRRGGLMAHAALASIVIVAALTPGSWAQRVLRFEPLAWLGRISYGLYLFQWPLIVWLTPARLGFDGPAMHLTRIGLAVGLAALSHRLLELRVQQARPRLGARRLAAVGVAATAAILAATLAAPSAAIPVVDEQVAASARPPTFQGTSIAEIAASAELTVAQAEPDQPPARAEAPAPEPTAEAGFVLELERPEDGLSLGQALDISRSVGSAPSALEPELEPTGRAFDYASAAPRVIIFGDSAALMLGFGLNDWSRVSGQAQFLDLALLGCGLTRGGYRSISGKEIVNKDESCGDWAPAYRSLNDLLEPNLIVFNFGPWEVVEQLLPNDTQWRSVGDPRFDAYLASEIKAATTLFTDQGVPVIWVTSPVVSLAQGRGETPAKPNSSDDPARIFGLNELVRQSADADPLAGLVDLYEWFEARPAGPLDPSLRPDGIHVTIESSGEVAQWLGPALMAEYARLNGAGG